MIHRKLIVPVLLLAAVFVIATPARSDEAPRFKGTEWSLLNAKQVLSAAAEVDLAHLPDCDEALVDRRSVRLVHEDGTAEVQDEYFTKVLTEKGKRDNNTVGINFMLPYMTAEVSRLEVIRPNGDVLPVDIAANAKESIDDSQMQANIYDPNAKVLRVNVPNLEIGDMLHGVVRVTILRSFIPGAFAEDNLFEDHGYIRHASLEVRTPKSKPLTFAALRNEIPGTMVASTGVDDGLLVYRWEANRVPRMFDEPAMPPGQEVLQRISLSTMPDWQTVSKWYWNLSQSHLDTVTPEMKAKVAELTAGAANDLDRTKAIFYWVSKTIRYMGVTPEKDRPGLEPHDVNLTFERKHGVCRDKAALLVALLRNAGLKAYPVLISVGWKKDMEVPNSFFNHAIVGVELPGSGFQLMDPTDENTRDLLPTYESNQTYLVCRPEGDVLRLSPIDPPEKSMMRITTTGSFNASGALVARSAMSFEGVNDNAYRQAFAEMKPDDRRRFFEANLKAAIPGASLRSLRLSPENMLDTSQTLRAEIEFSVPSAVAFGEGKAVVDVPWVGNGMGIVNYILGGTGLDKRRFPLETSVACGLHEELTLRMAGSFTGTVSMPSCEPRDDSGVAYRRDFSFKDGVLACTRDLRLKTVEYSPSQYLDLKKLLKELQTDDRKSPVLATTADASGAVVVADAGSAAPVESDSRILEENQELRIKDAHSAVMHSRYVKEILTYGGKKKDAEIKVDFNPAVSEARVLRGVVISKDGSRQELSPTEVNVMDAGWNASAKRYTGGKILVANLPGVDIGSRIEVEFEITYHDKAFFSGFNPLQEDDELVKKQVRLLAPADLPVAAVTSGPEGSVVFARRNVEGQQELTWTSTEVKAMPNEYALPPNWLYQPGALFFAGKAGDYLGELNRTLLDRSAHGEKAAELAKKLAEGAKTRLDAAKAVRDRVARAIRYAGPAFTELPLKELSNADTTLADGYGHDADRAILLHSMLSALGFKPEFVLASRQPAIDPVKKVLCELPMPYEFQKLLVRIEDGGTTYYFNDTDQYARLGVTTHEGTLAIGLSDQRFFTVEAAKEADTRVENSLELRLDDTGKARLKIRHEFFGAAFGDRNKFFTELPPEERNRYFQQRVSQVSQGARPLSPLRTDFSSYPGVEEFEVEIDQFAVADGKFMYLELPHHVRPYPAFTDRHTLPLMISKAHQEIMHARVELPKGFGRVVIAPKSEKLVAPAGAGTVVTQTQVNGGVWTMTQDVSVKPALIPSADYPALLSQETTLENMSARLLLLEK